MAQRIIDGLRKWGFGRDVLEHLGQPRLQFRHQRPGLVLASSQSYLGARAPDTFLDSVDRRDALDHFLSERRLRRLVDLHEPSSCMRQTEGEADCSSLARILGQRLVGHIAVDLQDTRIVNQLRRDLTLAAAVREHIGHRRRRWSAPWAVVDRMSPELAGLGAAPSGIEDRHSRLVAEEQWRRMDGSQLELVEPLQPPSRSLYPARQGRAIEMDAVTSQDLHLPVQRGEPGELRDHHMGHQRSRRHAVLDQPRQRLRLYHCAFTAPAGIFGADHAEHPQDRRNDVEQLADVLADLVQPALAARTRGRLRLDDLLAAWQMLGQRADVALGLLTGLPDRTSWLAWHMIVVGGCR